MTRRLPDLRRWIRLLRLLFFIVLISHIDEESGLSSFTEQKHKKIAHFIFCRATDWWNHVAFWWIRTDRIRHQFHMLIRDRTVFSHAGQICDDLAQCLDDHWQPDPNWTLAEYFVDEWMLYAMLKYRPSGLFFPAVDYASAIEDQWMKHRIDEGGLLAIRKGSALVPIACLLTKEYSGGSRTRRGYGFEQLSRAREELWNFVGEAEVYDELREDAEYYWHDHERDGRYAEWEEEFGSLYAQHALWKWDAQYYQRADPDRQQFLSKGLLDPDMQEEDERSRRLLCRIYTLPETASWEHIRDAIWQADHQVQGRECDGDSTI